MKAAVEPVLRRKRAVLLTSARGMTLLEIMISLAVLVITTVGGVTGFMMLNKFASNERNLSMARALCQERIEQVLTETYQPISSILPSVPSADPTNTGALTPLGTAANYSSGTYTGGNNLQTSTETIPVSTQSEGVGVNNSANVTYTRTCTVSPAGLYQMPVGANGAVSTSSVLLNTVQFTVNVSYVFRGATYTTFMTTLRSQD